MTGRFFYYRNSANGVKTVLVQPYNQALNPTQVLERVEAINGEAIWRMDFTAGYTRRVELFGRKSALSLQLNVRDLFERTDPSARRYRPVGGDGAGWSRATTSSRRAPGGSRRGWISNGASSQPDKI